LRSNWPAIKFCTGGVVLVVSIDSIFGLMD
jgi:hypothetical protein